MIVLNHKQDQPAETEESENRPDPTPQPPPDRAPVIGGPPPHPALSPPPALPSNREIELAHRSDSTKIPPKAGAFLDVRPLGNRLEERFNEKQLNSELDLREYE